MANTPMTTTPAEDFISFARGIATDTREFVLQQVAEAVAPVKQRLAALERRPDLPAGVKGPIDTGEQDATIGDAITAAVKTCRAAGLNLKQIDAMCDLTLAFLGPTFSAYRARIHQLEARPAGKGLRYLGFWEDGRVYEPDDCVSRGGSMFVCRKGTRSAIPAHDEESSEFWALAVKRGRDATNKLEQRVVALEAEVRRLRGQA